ncbi:ATPase, T2SS/T4P/T4SS family [Paraburkholderia ginsengisoli]|uniref:Flp pilus assembly complex ATPase component TadA n=1 Tax=Paraburkholderia ginsengisoli TaxID=311231 RepID=A0A7T4N7M3_9BURK|nr:ATPase, T2SS/T4P/T4SS family [Paraburkholderia ginsengisoli]QQC66726.1 Flp pilus assembly complex ATPase component TadA [Paraburkholderia ginsengisoli]
MLNLQIHTRNAPMQTLQIELGCTIGKSASCDIVVRGMLIGKLQARIVRENNAYYIEDQGGIAATLVNGTPITRYGPLTEADQIEVGMTTIKIVRAVATAPVVSLQPLQQMRQMAQQQTPQQTQSAQHTHAPQHHAPHADAPALQTAYAAPQAMEHAPPMHRAQPVQLAQAHASTHSEPSFIARASALAQTNSPDPLAAARTASASVAVAAQTASAPTATTAAQRFPSAYDVTPSARPHPAPDARLRTPSSHVKRTAAVELPVAPINSPLGIELRKQAHMKVIAALDLRRLNVARMEEDELRKTVSAALDDILNYDRSFHTADVPLDTLKKSVFDEIIGLGPLEELIADPSVSEIMVNCHNEIFVEQNGRLRRSPVIFTDDRAVLGAIERIVAPIGRRIDESSPMVDARLADGSRVNAVIPPLALKGPSITIRKFLRRKLKGEDLISFGSVSPDMLEFLHTAVEQGANIIISGGTGSGKTTLLNVLSNYIPDDERIVTVEDAAELQLSQPNLVSLEARPANMEGKGAIHIRDLVKNCLRMRPDRIVVGECRGGEALDMLQAMNTGHDGSLTTLHANTPRDCIARLEVMTLMTGLDLPVQAIREQISSAVDLIVQQSRFSCGSRRVTHVTEVSGMESGVITLQDVFVFKEDGFGEDGKIRGEFVPTAYIPDFYQDLIRRRISVNTDIFTRVN